MLKLSLKPLFAIAATTCLLFFSASSGIQAQSQSLPQIGSSAEAVISPAEESRYAEYLVREFRRLDMLVEDPLLESWMQDMAFSLAAASDKPDNSFSFLLLKDRQINAFATIGGVIGTNAGLILISEREDEVAGVLGHEISHVTQAHVLRAYERAKKNQLPILLGMLGMIAIAAQSDSNSSDAAIGTAIIGGQALMAQLMINYTRSNESEADRIGIGVLHRAGYDPEAIADFFERMERANRGNSGGYQIPDFLRTHPVTSTRIAEARARAQKIKNESQPTAQWTAGTNHPLLGKGINLDLESRADRPDVYLWARERLRVLSADNPAVAVLEYKKIAEASDDGLKDEQSYGLALAMIATGKGEQAQQQLEKLLSKHPGQLWLRLARAEALHQNGKSAQATSEFDALLQRYPNNKSITLTYAGVLNEIATTASGRRAQEILRPLLAASSSDITFQRRFARASELAGDTTRAREVWAEVALMQGRAEDALNQLEALKKMEDLDYVQRSRIEARIATIMPLVLELRKRGIRAQDQGKS